MEVKQEGVTNRNSKQYVWTTDDKIELYICYRLAKIQKLKVQQGTYDIWKFRNPHVKCKINAATLNKKRILFEKSIDSKNEKSINDIIATDTMKRDLVEIYKCYCLAKTRHLISIEGTYSIWMERNPDVINGFDKKIIT